MSGGSIWLLSLLVDNTSVVKGMQLEAGVGAELDGDAAAVTACGDGFLFFASRLGDSTLVKYSETGSYPLRVPSTHSPSLLSAHDVRREWAGLQRAGREGPPRAAGRR